MKKFLLQCLLVVVARLTGKNCRFATRTTCCHHLAIVLSLHCTCFLICLLMCFSTCPFLLTVTNPLGALAPWGGLCWQLQGGCQQCLLSSHWAITSTGQELVPCWVQDWMLLCTEAREATVSTAAGAGVVLWCFHGLFSPDVQVVCISKLKKTLGIGKKLQLIRTTSMATSSALLLFSQHQP